MKFLKIVLPAVFLFSVTANVFAADDVNSDAVLSDELKRAKAFNDKMIYVPPKPFKLADAGTEKWVNYQKYGEFQNVGTKDYKYVISDSEGLRAASGEGVFPNTQNVLNDPQYKKYLNSKKLEGKYWDFVNNDDYQANFYKWATTREDPGVKQYFTAVALDRAGNWEQAIKAYYAILVFFPKTIGWTQWQTPWYISPVAISRIKYLTALHPEIGVKLVGAKIIIENVYDNDVKNDVFIIDPGWLVPATAKDFETKTIDLSKIKIKKTVGKGKVKLVQYKNNNFQLIVDGKQFTVKGVSYDANKVGVSPVNGTLKNNRDWSWEDANSNGKTDAPFDAWVDTNRNDKQESYEKPVGDFALLKAMGANTLRVFHHYELNKEALKEGYEKYGFMYMMTDFLGAYAVDSGATWAEGTDYSNPVHQKNMLASIRKMVEDYKDEPYILMWVLGNENNYGVANNANKNPEAFYKFANKAAKLIKKLDPQKRPVAINNGDTLYLDIFAKNSPDIDIFGFNSYRGEQGFGNIWQDIANVSGKAALVTEYGTPAYAKGWSVARTEEGQASYHKGYWTDIENNLGGVEGGWGNSLGGVIFQWVDEWWKAEGDSDPAVHDTHLQTQGAFLDGGGYEEWYGITSQGNGKNSPFERQLRKAYFLYMDLWNK
ncbi:glycoside hydrolase family 2 TIM barrel-domain containing protein [Endomicrobium proavitum]|uniref:Glycoside hydrolase family 2 catalytic domain-containing protein n=1 Tax=Endomicrobium proavitum TaxID=1408281 RepID=A0A0G3WJG9_9BACT|nr:glycoside hydrolase family 2 TIM barrel-domain containing protein [Endomicrobium proavitum]AKL98002.1 conserved exported protein of unknown function [Endomicrobium proavitum]